MPYRKGYKRYKTRRTFKRRMKGRYRKKRSRRNVITRWKLKGVNNFPDSIYTKMIWSHIYTSAGVSASFANRFALNSIYHCDVTAGSGEAMLSDQMFPLYNKFEVRASKFSVAVANQALNPFRVWVIPSNQSGPPPSIQESSGY